MSEAEIFEVYRELDAVLLRLRAAEAYASGQELALALTMRRVVHRALDHDDLRIVDQLDRCGFFVSHKTYPALGVVELTGCRKSEATRTVRLASALFSSATLDGQPIPPVLPATAAAFDSWSIDLDHAVVIRRLLASGPARRLDPERWVAAERQLARWAQEYHADQLSDMGRRLLDGLDQDGAEPDHELDNQTNELHVIRSPDGLGGWIKGRLDSVTFDALVQVIEALIKPCGDEGKARPERQADALGEMCERLLDVGELPDAGGQAPHLTVVIEHEKLRKGLRGGSLTATGCRIGPREIRRIACASDIIPLVLGGQSEPLDVDRAKRHATRYQRAVLAVRDGGCAHPGCTTAAKWCPPHHIQHWVNGGNTDLDNLVLLCRTHHRMSHEAGWVARIRDGLPEFIPPRWIDINQTPRRKPRQLLLA
jgi:5-methylcytosine-specific restriction protein A